MRKIYDEGENIVSRGVHDAGGKIKADDCPPCEWIMPHGYASPGDNDIKALAAYLSLGKNPMQ